jgi:lipoprotein-releasing system permease protein
LNVPFYIARRYFLQGKKFSFINIISLLSILLVTLVTASLVIILSVFNGMEGVIRTLFTSFDPPIKIEKAKGKTFFLSDSLLHTVQSTEGVRLVTQVVEDNAMISYKDQNHVVRLKGLSKEFLEEHRIDSMMIDGNLRLEDSIKDYAIVGAGLQYKLSISLHNEFAPLTLHYPNRSKLRTGGTSVATHLNSSAIHPTGVFAIEKQYDDEYLLAPIDFVRSLMDLDGKCTSLEVCIREEASLYRVKESLQERLGPNYKVMDIDEQHATMIRALKIEKLAVSIILCSVLAIASVGIYFCLSILALRKKHDMHIFAAVGASPSQIRSVFLMEGQLIALSGAVLGLSIGFIVCYLQQTYGFVGLGMSTSVVDSYPVAMQFMDFVAIFPVVVILTFLASLQPAASVLKK